MKSRGCFVIELPGGLKDLPGDKSASVMASVRTAFTGLLDEIKLSFGYHENQSGGSIDEIYISGGGFRFTTLEEVFSEALTSKPKEWNPLQFMDIDPARINIDELVKVKDFFAVAAGLVSR